MRVLVACEFSGRVREAFRSRGHQAISVDLLDSELPGPHYKGTIQSFFGKHATSEFDLMICHPPCTYLAGSGARWWKDREIEQLRAIRFCQWLLSLEIPRIALENPVGILSTKIRRPDQIIQPYHYGHTEKKSTCLWLKNLPRLRPLAILPVEHRTTELKDLGPGKDRWKERSRTFQGIADAMADQWGVLKV